jgi:hypothetical protein
MEKWTHKGYSPAHGKIYHKNDRIMIVYSGRIKMFCNVDKDKEMLPCNAEYVIGRNPKGRVIGIH